MLLDSVSYNNDLENNIKIKLKQCDKKRKWNNCLEEPLTFVEPLKSDQC